MTDITNSKPIQTRDGTGVLNDKFASLSVEQGERMARQRAVVNAVLWLFSTINLLVAILIGFGFGYDIFMLKNKMIIPEQRLINSTVILSILGATTIQLGSAFFLIARFYFPVNEPTGNSDT